MLPATDVSFFKPKLHNPIQRTKPSTVRLNSPRFSFVFAFLKSSSLDDLPILVADSFSAIKHFESTDLLGIAVEIFALDFG